MTPKQISLVQNSWQKVLPIAPQAAEIFYDTLFEMDPSLKTLFPNDITEQGKKLMAMLDTAVKLLDKPDKLIPALENLGAKHHHYGAEPEHYDTVGAALLKTLAQGLGDDFTAPIKKAWTVVYQTLATTMIAGANAAAKTQSAKGPNMEQNTVENEQSNKLTAQFQGALDQSATAFMMIDRDFNVTYANQATLSLLKKHEATFAENWPGFKADKDTILSANIDSFHTNPSHQRELLSDPNNLPYKTDITIKHLTFELNVSAIFNENDEYIGNALEWQDVTVARAQENKAAQLQGAIDQSGTANIMIDRDFNITYANAATLALLKEHEAIFAENWPGFVADPEVIIGTNIDSFHKVPSHQRKLLDDPNNLPFKTDIQIKHLSFELIVTAIMDASGEYIGNSLEWQDVTAMRAQENKTAQLQGAIDQSGTANIMIDRDFNITYANAATLALLKEHEATFAENWPGFVADPEVIIGTNIDSFHKVPSHQRKLLDDPNNLPFKTDIQIKHLSFELNVTAIMDASGEYIGNALEWQDVTAIRAQENKTAQLQGAIDQSGTANIMIDRDFNITYANAATLALLKEHEATFAENWPGFVADPEVIIGTNIDSFHKVPSHQRKLLDDPNNLPFKTDIQIKHLSFELNVTAIMDASGEYIGNALEWQDVTAIRAQENKTAQLQGAIDQSGTANIMIDRDFNITYANAATLALLKEHEATFAENWPGFVADPEVIIGTCIDTFHKNPAHQRKLLDDPNNLPFKTDIQIKHLSFELNVTAIMDASGEYIGNALEWQDVTAARQNSIEVGRLTSTMEGMTTNIMMADTQGNIVYANPSVKTMLRRREATLRTVLPSFSVDTMVGTNFDTFHKNPAHQQNLLGNPNNLPYTTEISVAGLTFQLIAMALLDSEGNHVGTGVQWVDLTEEKDAQGQIDRLISDAIAGKLDSRIDVEEYQGFMKELGTNINSLMDSIVEPINDAINIATALADGDLTQTMRNDYGGEFLALANAMNGSIENISNMVDEIRNASTNVFDSAREIAAGNNELSHRTESQASSLEETASAMEELTSTVQQNAENSSEASKLSKSVMEKASNGGTVVRSAIVAMSDINKSSKKIADIISVIDEIAFQTNLLALNAAVEAARAGEQGRGFAVVAAEVRNLAQRSAGAAKEIKGLINDSVEAVGQGTKLVDETGQTFSELVTAIEEVSRMISDIDNAGKEQSAGISEVSAAVSQMDEMTQQNAALVEEAAASSKSMEEQAQLLLDQVAFFDNGETVQQPVEVQRQQRSAQPRQPRQARQADPAARQSNFSPASAPAPTDRRPASAPAPTDRRPASTPAPTRRAKRPSTPVDKEWEEF
ncbi:methyl-accepting chemotaxis protein [Colwellia sp. TT2012]|uniref:methyl-accepting chemotaxis protein n=1 Tax=Colwellia sp. TT2012 TaxID=1720342 RepID=UPI0009E69BF7|nr:methyl-accepting chemotaxis protein [Colwellia sp. TT2012]